MRLHFAVALGCCVPFSSTAYAQISSFTLDIKGDSVTVAFNAPRGLPAPAVTGAPYSADQVSENVLTLADGTHLTQNTNVRHFVRDSHGRTRTDRPLLATQDGRNLRVIEIRDPVEGFYYIVDQQNKVAHRFATPAGPARPAVAAQAVTAPSKPSTDGGRPQISSEKLGSQMLEGVMVEGYRSTTTWPVGTQGNDRPIVTTYESWFSEALETEVLTKSSHPRSGESTFKLTRIERTEPDPALFQVPPDYSVVDEKGSFTMTATRR